MNQIMLNAFLDELEKIAGKFDEDSYNKFKSNLRTGDIINFDRSARHSAIERGLKTGLDNKKNQLMSEFATGGKHYHTGIIERHPETGEIRVHHHWYGPNDKLQLVSQPLDEAVGHRLSFEDLKAYRPKGISEEDARKAVDYLKMNVGSEYVSSDQKDIGLSSYYRRSAKKYKPGTSSHDKLMQLASDIESKHLKQHGGLLNCDASGVCSTIPAKAYSQANPEFAKKYLGIEGDHRLVSPTHYEDAAKLGKLDTVGEYNFADRKLSRTKAFFKGLAIDTKKGLSKLKRLAKWI